MKKFVNEVIVISNPLNHEGGIVNYYNLFFQHFKSDDFKLKHFSVGSRAYLFYFPVLKRLLYPFYLLFDLLRFVMLLIINRKIKIIQVSPSLILVPLIRDGLFIIIAKLFNKKVIVFYRGWKLPVFNKLKSNKAILTLFNNIYQKNTQQIVLATSFKENLRSLGFSAKYPVLVTTTAIDRENIIVKEKAGDLKIKVLFLGRIQDLKGVKEIIDAVILLNENSQLDKFMFTIVGHEFKKGYVDSLKKLLKDANVPDESVSFPGRIAGKEKFEIYASNDIYLLPSYTEGCPNSALEALGSGLFCISTNVGVLDDIIEHKQNGLIVEVKNSQAIYEALIECLNNKAYLSNRVERAQEYSKKFDIREIVTFFEIMYKSY